MVEFNYTDQGRRPSVRQIVSDWKKADCPDEFEVTYGETFAVFECDRDHWSGPWRTHGNGQRGVDRDAVVKELNRIQS